MRADNWLWFENYGRGIKQFRGSEDRWRVLYEDLDGIPRVVWGSDIDAVIRSARERSAGVR